MLVLVQVLLILVMEMDVLVNQQHYSNYFYKIPWKSFSSIEHRHKISNSKIALCSQGIGTAKTNFKWSILLTVFAMKFPKTGSAGTTITTAQFSEMILKKIEKNLNRNSKSVPLKILAIRAWNPPARQQCQISPVQAVLAVFPRSWIPRPES